MGGKYNLMASLGQGFGDWSKTYYDQYHNAGLVDPRWDAIYGPQQPAGPSSPLVQNANQAYMAATSAAPDVAPAGASGSPSAQTVSDTPSPIGGGAGGGTGGSIATTPTDSGGTGTGDVFAQMLFGQSAPVTQDASPKKSSMKTVNPTAGSV